MVVQPAAGMRPHALELLEQLLGPGAAFRPGQWEAVEAVAVRRGRALVVQRTGWGKSLVYFLATRLLRDAGAGPTLLVSPLLALMRNQIAMAGRIGIRALTLNSANRAEWDAVEAALAADACDVLLISPERLANVRFASSLLPGLLRRAGLLVVDEAHCISDWGHDFRPDYRRMVRIVQSLPPGVPVLGTTATANDRVVADVQAQLGPGLTVLRGPLARTTLRLQNIALADQAERLAWLAEYLPQLPGSGVVYCLTVADARRVAGWLQARGLRAEAYHAGDDALLDREDLERKLLRNDVKALVATVALGMGFDKPDLGFVVHFQRPPSVVGYYQQVGRAGRAVDRAHGILLSGREDDEIAEYFIESAFPSAGCMQAILAALAVESRSLNELLDRVNVARATAEKALKLLEVDGAVSVECVKGQTRYVRTPAPWQPDHERIERVTGLRRAELAQMQAYVAHPGCLMEFLARALDDPAAGPCGQCANCRGEGVPVAVRPELVAAAVDFLRHDEIVLEPRKRWPVGLFPGVSTVMSPEAQNAPGRALCEYGDVGWGRLVREGKYAHGRFPDELVVASVELIRERWQPDPPPEWVAAIPSRRRVRLVYDWAERVAAALGLPFVPALVRTGEAAEQKTMANSAMQARNVRGTLAVGNGVRGGPVLLLDDIVDSGWTLAMAGWLLRSAGSGVVYPFVLARARARNTGP